MSWCSVTAKFFCEVVDGLCINLGIVLSPSQFCVLCATVDVFLFPTGSLGGSKMVTPVSISLSGPALSFLLYENTKCRFQQEGFLLGEIVHNETRTITDNDQQQVNISKTIKINSMMSCPQLHYFYNGIGKIDKDKIKGFLGNQFSKVVAWYKYQRITSFKLTLRDKIIHKQLTDLFDIPSERFSYCLLINEVSDNGSTHQYSQAFMRYYDNVYDRLPIRIPNLSEPNNTYKNSEPASDTFNKLVGGLKIDRKNTQGLVVINKIQNAVQKHIDNVITELSEAERYMYELEEEIKQLEKLHKLKSINDVKAQNLRDSKNGVSHSKSNSLDEVNQAVGKSIDSDSVTPESSPDLPRKGKRGTRGRGRKKGGSVSNEHSQRLRKKN